MTFYDIYKCKTAFKPTSGLVIQSYPAHPKNLRMSLDELEAGQRLREDVKDFTTPSSGSQSNDRASHLISSHSHRGGTSRHNPDEFLVLTCCLNGGEIMRERKKKKREINTSREYTSVLLIFYTIQMFVCLFVFLLRAPSRCYSVLYIYLDICSALVCQCVRIETGLLCIR